MNLDEFAAGVIGLFTDEQTRRPIAKFTELSIRAKPLADRLGCSVNDARSAIRRWGGHVLRGNGGAFHPLTDTVESLKEELRHPVGSVGRKLKTRRGDVPTVMRGRIGQGKSHYGKEHPVVGGRVLHK